MGLIVICRLNVQVIDISQRFWILAFGLPLKLKLVAIDVELLLFSIFLLLLRNVLIVKPKPEWERGAYIKLALKWHGSWELCHNLLWNDETKPDSFGVHLLRVLHKSEKLEKLLLIFLGNTDSCVLHWDFNELFVQFVENDLNSYDNGSLLGELEGVRLEAKEHLHDSLLVRVDYWAVRAEIPRLVLSNIDKLCIEVNCLLLCLLSLNAHYFVYTLPDVKALEILSELIGFDLGIIEEILHHETHNVSRGLLHLQAFVKVFKDSFALDVFFRTVV